MAKYWIRDGKILAMFGLENQTNTDYDMPMRIFSYDGSSYKSQLMRTSKEVQDDARYPIITLMLYFGEKHWGEQGVSLKGMFGGPDEYVERVSKALAKRQEKGEQIMGCNISKAWMDLGRKEGIREGIEETSKEMNLRNMG